MADRTNQLAGEIRTVRALIEVREGMTRKTYADREFILRQSLILEGLERAAKLVLPPAELAGLELTA